VTISEMQAHPLHDAAQAALGPNLRFVVQATASGFLVDIAGPRGDVAWPAYASGPSPLLAVLAAEQRYRAEELGQGTVPGGTYAEKAVERLHRWEREQR
jgi:hypothetical protein